MTRVGSPRTFTILTLVLALTAGAAAPARAGGPLSRDVAAAPVGWDPATPLPYSTDQGNLGTLDHTAAVAKVEALFGPWQDVGTATLAYERAGDLTVNVDASNFGPYLSAYDSGSTAPLGFNPIVFDADGAIFDQLYGVGTGVVGFAGPTWFSNGSTTAQIGQPLPAGARIVEGIAFLNGKMIDGIDGPGNPELSSMAWFDAAFVHEFGHLSGLDHTQVHGLTLDTGDFVEYVETMFPFLIHPGQSQPKRDDRIALSLLYPAPGFAAATGCLTGRVLAADGAPVAGANLIAEIPNDFDSSASTVSGSDPSAPGAFSICGLPPGAGWRLRVEEIDAFHNQGSSVGPFDPPLTLSGPPEFYSGGLESRSPAADPPAQAVSLAVAAGALSSGLDIRLNAQHFRVRNQDWVGSADNQGPRDMVLADFDGDDRLDILGAEIGSQFNGIRLARGQGDGSFAPAEAVADLPGAANLEAADFDGDLHLDFAATSSFLAELRWYRGDGAGGFTPAATLVPSPGVSFSQTRLATADFNLDGKPDLAYIFRLDNAALLIRTFLGNGAGGFSEVQSSLPAAAGYPIDGTSAVALGDFGGGSAPDLLLATGSAIGLTLLVADGSGGFSRQGIDLSSQTSRLGNGLAAGDLNGDGNLDFAVSNLAPPGLPFASVAGSYIDLWLADGSGGFLFSHRLRPGEVFQAGIVLADLDGDRALDIVSSDSYAGRGRPGATLHFALGDGAGRVRTVEGPQGMAETHTVWGLAEFPVLSYPETLQPGDLDGDGDVDFVLSAKASGVFGISVPPRISSLLWAASPSPGRDFYTLAPCRVLDSRGTTRLGAGETRPLAMSPACGIPATARAVAINVTALNADAIGQLSIFPGPLAPFSETSVVPFRPGLVRASSAVLALALDGGGELFLRAVGAGADVIIDVNGYFE